MGELAKSSVEELALIMMGREENSCKVRAFTWQEAVRDARR